MGAPPFPERMNTVRRIDEASKTFCACEISILSRQEGPKKKFRKEIFFKKKTIIMVKKNDNNGINRELKRKE